MPEHSGNRPPLDGDGYHVFPIGQVHSPLTQRALAPKQGWEGAPDARLEVFEPFLPALDGVVPGAELIVVTWLHESQRDTLRVHPRDDPRNPLTGVFATRSSDRPNPLGLHRVTVVSVDDGRWLAVRGLEAIDGTPIIDLKPAIDRADAQER